MAHILTKHNHLSFKMHSFGCGDKSQGFAYARQAAGHGGTPPLQTSKVLQP